VNKSKALPGSIRSSRSDSGAVPVVDVDIEDAFIDGTVTVGLRFGDWLTLVAGDPPELRGSSMRLLNGEMLSQSDQLYQEDCAHFEWLSTELFMVELLLLTLSLTCQLCSRDLSPLVARTAGFGASSSPTSTSSLVSTSDTRVSNLRFATMRSR